MKDTYVTLIEKRRLKELFLIITDEWKKYLKKKDIFWIYIIRNTKNDKVYIGKTVDINQRALNYVNDYLKGEISREISKAIYEIGIDSFSMFPLEIATNEISAEIKEKYYIDKFNSIDSGYNMILNSTKTYKNRKRPSVPQTLYSKTIKSKLIASINIDSGLIVFSTGLKLFGDFIGRSKDEIKSAAKRETKLENYYIYYLNPDDLSKQLENANSKISRNTVYMDYKLQYHDFLKYSNYLISIIHSKGEENPENFKMIFITQSNDDAGYKIEDIGKFFANFSKCI